MRIIGRISTSCGGNLCILQRSGDTKDLEYCHTGDDLMLLQAAGSHGRRQDYERGSDCCTSNHNLRTRRCNARFPRSPSSPLFARLNRRRFDRAVAGDRYTTGCLLTRVSPSNQLKFPYFAMSQPRHTRCGIYFDAKVHSGR